jgi:hypothetical protein
LERGGSVPWRIGYRLEMARIEAEELRMWGNRELTRQLREGLNLNIFQHANRTERDWA